MISACLHAGSLALVWNLDCFSKVARGRGSIQKPLLGQENEGCGVHSGAFVEHAIRVISWRRLP
jgi:hypothetical protein